MDCEIRSGQLNATTVKYALIFLYLLTEFLSPNDEQIGTWHSCDCASFPSSYIHQELPPEIYSNTDYPYSTTSVLIYESRINYNTDKSNFLVVVSNSSHPYMVHVKYLIMKRRKGWSLSYR